MRAKAQAQGISAEQYAQQVLAHELETINAEPFWKAFSRRMNSVPDAVFAEIPVDAASKHDHFLYGSLKNDQ